MYIGPERARIELSAVFVEELFEEKVVFFVLAGGNGLVVMPCWESKRVKRKIISKTRDISIVNNSEHRSIQKLAAHISFLARACNCITHLHHLQWKCSIESS